MLNLIRLDDQSQAVTKLQLALSKALKIQMTADGFFGPVTEKAVREYQTCHGLASDGIVGPATIKKLGLDMTPGDLTDQDIADAAKGMGLTFAHLKAIAAVESAGEGFLKDGRPIILYERHVFWERAQILRNPEYKGDKSQYMGDFIMFAHANPDICNKNPGGYLGLAKEYGRLERAREFSDTAALESCSWGMFQIMGYHAISLGYKSVQAFVRAMQASEDDQLFALIRFIKNDKRLVTALKKADWAGFARIYNGKNYAKNKYDTKLAAAFTKYSGPAYAQYK